MQLGKRTATAAVGTLVALTRAARALIVGTFAQEIFVLRQEMNCLRTGSWSLGGHGRRRWLCTRHILGEV